MGNKTIYELVRRGDFPRNEDDRKLVEDVVEEIRQHIQKYQKKIWKNKIPNSKECFAIELPEDIYNGVTIPRGKRLFYLTASIEDYFYIYGDHCDIDKAVCYYQFSEEQEKYFEYLMARQGAVRQIIISQEYPTQIKWYLV